MDEVARMRLSDDGHRAEVHDDSSITVDAPDAPFGTRERETERNGRGVPHRTDRQEIVRVILAARLA